MERNSSEEFFNGEEEEEDAEYPTQDWNSRNFYLGPITESNPFDIFKKDLTEENEPKTPEDDHSQPPPKKPSKIESQEELTKNPPLKKIKKNLGRMLSPIFKKKRPKDTQKKQKKKRVKRRKKLEKLKFKRLKQSIQYRAKKTLDIIPSNEITHISEIHKDEYSILYKSKWKGREVATKIFTFNVVEEPLKICFFNHQYLLQIHGMYLNKSKTEPQVGLVTEWCENRDLKSYFQKNSNKLRFLDKLDLIKKIVTVISYLHSNGYIIEELKSKSILLTKNLTPKLSIYALTQLFKHQHDDNSANKRSYYSVSQTRQHESMSYYRAPEIILAKSFSSSVDLFSLGYIMYEILFENFDPFGKIKNEKGTLLDNFDLFLAIEQDLRPQLNLDIIPDDELWLIELLVKCWSYSENNRPFIEVVLKTIIDEKKKIVMSEFAKSVQIVDEYEIDERKEIRARLLQSSKAAKEMYFSRPFFKGDYKAPDTISHVISTDSTSSFEVPKITSKGECSYDQKGNVTETESSSSMDDISEVENSEELTFVDDSRLKSKNVDEELNDETEERSDVPDDFYLNEVLDTFDEETMNSPKTENYSEVKNRNIQILLEEKQRSKNNKKREKDILDGEKSQKEGFYKIPTTPAIKKIIENSGMNYDYESSDVESVGDDLELENVDENDVGKGISPILLKLKKKGNEMKAKINESVEVIAPNEEDVDEIDITEITKHKRRVPPIPIPRPRKLKKKFYSSLPKELPSFLQTNNRNKYRLKRNSDIYKKKRKLSNNHKKIVENNEMKLVSTQKKKRKKSLKKKKKLENNDTEEINPVLTDSTQKKRKKKSLKKKKKLENNDTEEINPVLTESTQKKRKKKSLKKKKKLETNDPEEINPVLPVKTSHVGIREKKEKPKQPKKKLETNEEINPVLPVKTSHVGIREKKESPKQQKKKLESNDPEEINPVLPVKTSHVGIREKKENPKQQKKKLENNDTEEIKPALPLKTSHVGVVVTKHVDVDPPPKLPKRVTALPKRHDPTPTVLEKTNSNKEILNESKKKKKKKKKKKRKKRPRSQSGNVNEKLKTFTKEKKLLDKSYWEKRKSMHPITALKNFYGSLPQMYVRDPEVVVPKKRDGSPRPPVPSRRGVNLKKFKKQLEKWRKIPSPSV